MNQQAKMASFRLSLVAMSSSVLLACATISGARPEDVSAQSHEEEAAQHATTAELHEAKYDPNAPGASAEAQGGTELGWERVELNPTEVHNILAAKHRKHADDHLAAAAELRRAEEDACESIASETRSWCPLLGPVVAVENTPNGVRISVRDGTDMEAMVARIRCHVAYANTQGREGMDRCPLYVRGAQVRQSGPASIELSAPNKASVLELQQRVADHVAE